MGTKTVQPVNRNTYTKLNTGLGPLIIEPKEYAIYVSVSETEPGRDETDFHIVEAGDRFRIESPDFDTWALGTTDKQSIAVTEEINTIEVSDRGSIGVAVYIQDQTTGLLDLRFLNELSIPTLAVDTVLGSRDITLSSGHGLSSPTNNGDVMEIADTGVGAYFDQSKIVTIAGDVVTLDNPVSRIYTTGNTILSHSNQRMNVDGSITPQMYSVKPFAAQSGDVVRIIFEIRDDADMDFETFGGLPALINGCVLRIKNSDGTYRNIFNFKTNGDIIALCYDHGFFLNKGGSVRGFDARLTWGGQSKHGVVIRLDGALNESLEFVVQDDLTGLSGMRIIAQGSELQE